MSAGTSAYSPLPQSNSDSDGSSEEELHIPQGNRIVNRTAKVQSSKGDKTPNEENNVVSYKALSNEGDIGVTLNKFHPVSDKVSIVKSDGGLEIFSTSRKICFVLSLLLCVFTTVAFLWILPCDIGSCPSVSDFKKYNFTWEKNLPNIEIYGPIRLVPDHNGNQNLLILTRSFLNLEKNYSENGLRCIKGIDGSFKWKIQLTEEPTDVDCTLFDINDDGFSDCLIYGNNFLRAFHSFSGQKLWDIQEANKNKYKIYFRDFPLVIPDLNRDKVKELILPCSVHSYNKIEQERTAFQNNIIIISGKTGEIINKPLQFQLCSAIKNLMLENNSITYNCFLFDKKESFQSISLKKFYKTLKNWPNKSVIKWKLINQHKKASDTAYVNGFRLILKNQGNCPEDCQVSVDVKDEHESSNNKTIYSFELKNTFGMAPVILNNKKESGFVLKFWKWHSKTENLDVRDDAEFSAQETIIMRNKTKNITKRSKKLNFLLNSSKILENEMLLESDYEFQRMKRTATRPRKNKFGRSFFFNSLHVISETINKIAFNSSYFSTSNLTKREIIQICKKPRICQPNAFQQKLSILVAKLVPEGTEKLITYNSKYVHDQLKNKLKSEGWRLQSTIRVFNV